MMQQFQKGLQSAYQDVGKNAMDSVVKPPVLETSQREIAQLKTSSSRMMQSQLAEVLDPNHPSNRSSNQSLPLQTFMKMKMTPANQTAIINTFMPLFTQAVDVVLRGADNKLTDYVLNELHIFLKMDQRREPLRMGDRDWPAIVDPGKQNLPAHVESLVKQRLRPFFVDSHSDILQQCPALISRSIHDLIDKQMGGGAAGGAAKPSGANVRDEQLFDFFNQSGIAGQNYRGGNPSNNNNNNNNIFGAFGGALASSFAATEAKVVNEFSQYVWRMMQPMTSQSLKQASNIFLFPFPSLS
jgi:hypothetical protein